MSAGRAEHRGAAGSAIALSFTPLLLKAVDYTFLGGFVPLLVLVSFATLVVWGRLRSPRAARRTVAIWAWALILWGVTRLGLIGLLTWTSVAEAHVEGQFTSGYLLISVTHAALGVFLLRSRG